MFMMDAQQIYENFHGSGAKGTSALEQAQQTSYQLAGPYQDDAVAMQKLINHIGSGWTGQASTAASQGLAPMAENLLATGQDLNTHQDLVYRQAHSFGRAVSQVQQVPPAPSMTTSSAWPQRAWPRATARSCHKPCRCTTRCPSTTR